MIGILFLVDYIVSHPVGRRSPHYRQAQRYINAVTKRQEFKRYHGLVVIRTYDAIVKLIIRRDKKGIRRIWAMHFEFKIFCSG